MPFKKCKTFSPSEFRKTACFRYLNSPILSTAHGMPYYGPNFSTCHTYTNSMPPRHYIPRNDCRRYNHYNHIREDLWNASTKSSIYVPDTATLWFQRQRILRMVGDYMNKLTPEEAMAFQNDLCNYTSGYSIPPEQCVGSKGPLRMVESCPTSVQAKHVSPEFLKLLQDHDCRVRQQFWKAAYYVRFRPDDNNVYAKPTKNVQDSEKRQKQQPNKCICTLCRCPEPDNTVGDGSAPTENVEFNNPSGSTEIVPCTPVYRPRVHDPPNPIQYLQNSDKCEPSDKTPSKKKTPTCKDLEEMNEEKFNKPDRCSKSKKQDPLREIWTKPNALKMRDSSASLNRSLVIKHKRHHTKKKDKKITPEHFQETKPSKPHATIRKSLERLSSSKQKTPQRQQAKASKLKPSISKKGCKCKGKGKKEKRSGVSVESDGTTKIGPKTQLPKKSKKPLKSKSPKTNENKKPPSIYESSPQALKPQRLLPKKKGKIEHKLPVIFQKEHTNHIHSEQGVPKDQDLSKPKLDKEPRIKQNHISSINFTFPKGPSPPRSDNKTPSITYIGRRSKEKLQSSTPEMKDPKLVNNDGDVDGEQSQLSLEVALKTPHKDQSNKRRSSIEKGKERSRKKSQNPSDKKTDQDDLESDDIENYDTYFYIDNPIADISEEQLKTETQIMDEKEQERKSALIKPVEVKPKPWKAYNVTPPCSRAATRKRYFISCRIEDLCAAILRRIKAKGQSSWNKQKKEKEKNEQQQQHVHVEDKNKHQEQKCVKNYKAFLRKIYGKGSEDWINMGIKHPARYKAAALRTQHDLIEWKRRRNFSQIWSDHLLCQPSLRQMS